MIGPCALLSLYFITCTFLPLIIDAADIHSSSYLLRGSRCICCTYVRTYLRRVLFFSSFYASIASSFLRSAAPPSGSSPSHPRTSSDVLATCHLLLFLLSSFHLLTLTYTSAACCMHMPGWLGRGEGLFSVTKTLPSSFSSPPYLILHIPRTHT